MHTMSHGWKYGDFLRKFFLFSKRVSVGMSAYSVALLSIQRYHVTVYPLQRRVSAQGTRYVNVATVCRVCIIMASAFAVL
jgi:hypothetical protein